MTRSSLPLSMILISFVGVGLCCTALAAPLTDAYYFFDNTDTPSSALDSSGNGYSFPYLTSTTNAAQTTDQAKFGTGSMVVSSAGAGFGSQLTTSVLAPLNHVIDALTISLWVYPTTAFASGTTFFERLNSSGTNPGYVKFNYQSSRLRLTATDSSSQKLQTSTVDPSFALNTWTHIAVTYDGAGNLLFYKNGVQLGNAVTITGLTSIPATTNTANTWFRAPLSFGAGNYVDDFGYFGSRALTPTEINSIYTDGLAAFVIPEPGSLLLLSPPAPVAPGETAAKENAQIAKLEHAVIVLPTDASAVLKENAEKCREILSRMSGNQGQSKPSAASIFIGKPSDFPGKADGLTAPGDVFGNQGYRLTARDGNVFVLSESDTGAIFGIWDLMHRLGYRQYFPGPKWEIIPKKAALTFAGDVVSQPDYWVRLIGMSSAWDKDDSVRFEDWVVKNRISGKLPQFKLNTGHAYGRIITSRKQEFEEHPEYLALVDGARRPITGTVKLCYSNPAVQQIVREYALEELRSDPTASSVSMDPSDGGNHCQCEPCAAMGSVSDQVLTLANIAAKAIEKEFPDKFVAIYAYHLHGPPPNIPVHPKIIVSAAAGFYKGFTLPEMLRGWHEKGAMLLGVREYLSVVAWDYGRPGHSRTSNLSYWQKVLPENHKDGARFFTSRCGDDWGPSGLGYYFISRVLWDVKEAGRLDEIRKEFLTACFGAAAEPMDRFYKLLDGKARPLLTEDYFGRLYRALEEAFAKEPRPDVQERLEDLVIYVRYAELFQKMAHPDEDKEKAIEKVARFMGAERERAVVDSFRIWRELQIRNLVSKGTLIPTEKELGVESVEEHPWLQDPPLSRDQIRQLVKEGVAANPLLDFEVVQYSDELVPIDPPAQGPFPEGNFGFDYATAGARGKQQTFYTWLEANQELEVTIGGPGEGEQIQVDFFSPDDPLFNAAFTTTVPADGQAHKILVKSPYSGIHRVVLNPQRTKQVRAYILFPASARVAVQSALGDEYFYFLNWSLYFYVPKGTRTVAGYAEGPKGEMLNHLGETVFSFKTLGISGYFNVEVPEGGDGQFWKFQNCQKPRYLMTVPPYLTPSPQQALLPKEVVPNGSSLSSRDGVPSPKLEK